MRVLASGSLTDPDHAKPLSCQKMYHFRHFEPRYRGRGRLCQGPTGQHPHYTRTNLILLLLLLLLFLLLLIPLFLLLLLSPLPLLLLPLIHSLSSYFYQESFSSPPTTKTTTSSLFASCYFSLSTLSHRLNTRIDISLSQI